MVRTAFIKTMIEVLKYDKNYKAVEWRDDLIRLLGRADVNFVPQYAFASHGRSGQHWEVVEIRVPVPLLDVAYELEDEISRLVRFVYEESDELALQKVEIRPLVMDTPEEVKEYDVVFDEIQDTVIQGIRDAKFIIWAAVAWFSNEAIHQELLVKKKQGLNVRIIVSKEDSNNEMVSKLKAEGFDIKVVPRWGYRDYNRMHEKFCIIDMDYVMSGSYNWTPTANNNDEELSTALDHTLVSKYATEFMRLYNGVDN